MSPFALAIFALLSACSVDTGALAPGVGDGGGPSDAARDTAEDSSPGDTNPPPPGDTGVSDAGRDTSAPPADSGADTEPPPPIDAGVDTAVMPPLASDCDGPLSGAIFCDGFEDAPLAAWRLLPTRSGTVGRDTGRPLRGAGALRVDVTHHDDRAQAYTDAIGGLASGDLYFRAWYYLPAPGPTNATFLILQEGSAPWHHLSLNAEGGTNFSAWAAGPNVGFASPIPLPVGRWFCVQTRIEIDNTAGSVTTWIDGTVAAQRDGFDTLPGVGYAAVSVGMPWVSFPQGAYSLYVDEVAVDDAPIPCSP